MKSELVTAEKQECENMRGSAQGILETLEKAHEVLRIINGEYPGEAREEMSKNGSIDELSILLTDIRYSADRLAESVNKISNRI